MRGITSIGSVNQEKLAEGHAVLHWWRAQPPVGDWVVDYMNKASFRFDVGLISINNGIQTVVDGDTLSGNSDAISGALIDFTAGKVQVILLAVTYNNTNGRSHIGWGDSYNANDPDYVLFSPNDTFNWGGEVDNVMDFNNTKTLLQTDKGLAFLIDPVTDNGASGWVVDTDDVVTKYVSPGNPFPSYTPAGWFAQEMRIGGTNADGTGVPTFHGAAMYEFTSRPSDAAIAAAASEFTASHRTGAKLLPPSFLGLT